jgi:hypothetical protein
LQYFSQNPPRPEVGLLSKQAGSDDLDWLRMLTLVSQGAAGR